MNNMNNVNWSERGGAHRADMGLDIEALDVELRVLKIATAEVLEKMVQPLVKSAAMVGMVGEFGGRLLSTGRGRATTALLTVAIGLGACAASIENPTMTPVLPSVVATETAGASGSPEPSATVGVTPTEGALVGSGGPLSEAEQKAIEASPRYQDILKYTGLNMDYWQSVGVFAKDIPWNMKPLPDQSDPTNVDKFLYVIEIPGDQNFNYTIPIAPYMKYLETGDPEVMLPPQGATTLQENTDPFKMTKQVTKDSVPGQAGIPVGAVNGVKDGKFVYFAPGANGALEVVGGLDGDQWVKEDMFRLQTDMDNLKLNPDNYTTGYDKDGNIELREKGTNKLVYWNGRWSAMEIIKMVKKDAVSNNACESIVYGPATTGGNYVSNADESHFSEYRTGLINTFRDFMGLDLNVRIRYQMEYLGMDKDGLHCWGVSLETVFTDTPMDTNFAYRDDNQKLHVYPVFYSQDHK